MVTHDRHDDHEQGKIDPRVHADLDEEVGAPDVTSTTADDAHADRTERQLATLRSMESWLQASRETAPDHLADRVIDAVQRRGEPESVREGSDDRLAGWRRLRDLFVDGWRGAAWATPATALAVILLLMLGRHGLPPGEPAGDLAGPGTTVTADRGDDAALTYSFRIDAPDAGEVCLVGTFNHWSVCDNPMRRNDDGTWTATVPLGRGRHEYMFVIDGDWQSDPRADQVVDDGYGNLNAVLYL